MISAAFCRLALVAGLALAPFHTHAEPVVPIHGRVGAIVAHLPWRFALEVLEDAALGGLVIPEAGERVNGVVYRFTAVEPQPQGGGTRLRLQLAVGRFASAAAAQQRLQALSRQADPDTGLSYAWDTVLLSGVYLYRLDAGAASSKGRYILLK